MGAACRRTSRRPPRLIPIVACLLLTTFLSANSGPETSTGERLLLGESFPLRVSAAFHSAMLHWLDSLVGLKGHGFTAGKTVTAHRRQYEQLFGTLTARDRSILQRYRTLRLGYTQAVEWEDRDRLTLSFFGASDLDDALERATKLLDAGGARDLEIVFGHFESRYRTVWNAGKIPEGFVARATRSPRREQVAALLTRTARFLGVAARERPWPELIVVPVPQGGGTHAQAIGMFLLVEIREGERLVDQIAPIVHESVHFLADRIPDDRLETLARTASAAAPFGAEAWRLLNEALPTAIGQGVADRTFRPAAWSRERPWYHSAAVDGYAKRIFPLVERALQLGRRFDEAFVRELILAYEDPPARPAPRVTPRSP